MTPLFKSNFSIGKSILTLDPPSSSKDEEAADSIFDIAVENNLNKIFLIEDSMIGFMQAHKLSKQLNIHLIFGLRINCCNNVCSELEEKQRSNHKIIILSKNDDGCKLLNKIYSEAFCKNEGFVDCSSLSKYWNDNNLKLAIPFYDSFIYNNNFSLGNCIPNFSKFCDPIYFIERNNLPFDVLLEREVLKITQNPILSKTILYKKKEDVFALQTYKCITNRVFGREQSLNSPNLNHFGSDEFCWESFIEFTQNGKLVTI
jgi:DNA polymerase III alpha subunit